MSILYILSKNLCGLCLPLSRVEAERVRKTIWG